MGAALECASGPTSRETVTGEPVLFEKALPEHRDDGGLPCFGLPHQQDETGPATAAQRARFLERHRVVRGDERLRGGRRRCLVVLQFAVQELFLLLVSLEQDLIRFGHEFRARASSSSRRVWAAISSPLLRIVGSTP